MKRFKVVGSCLIAVIALSAAMAGSASAALPEFSGPFSKPFTSKSATSVLETVTKVKLVCTGDTNEGEVTTPASGVMKITFTGCTVKKIPCNSPGVVPGTIVTGLLSFTVGYINKAKKEVGMDLIPATGGAFIEFICGTTVRGIAVGSVIGRITPVNIKVVPPKTFTLKFAQTAGKQAVQNLEGGPKDTLETSYGGPFLESGFASADKILFKEPVILKA
jgi:hypothetical protein